MCLRFFLLLHSFIIHIYAILGYRILRYFKIYTTVNQISIMYLKLYDYAADNSLITMTMLYSASLTVSTSFQNDFTTKDSCNPMIPFGECPVGEFEAQMEARSDSILQHVISFFVVLLAGAWSDCHGRRRKPLILLPIIGQILTDSLYIVNNFWYWPSILDTIFTSIIPGLYVGRNLFWIGIMSYVSENSSMESRTLKLGMIIATYTFSSLMGSGVVAMLKIVKIFPYYYYFPLFMVPIFFNLCAVLIGYLFIEDTSISYNKDIVWLKPKYLFKGFVALFKNELKSFSIVLVGLIICESVFVARIGAEYAIILEYIKRPLRSFDDVLFTVTRMMAIVFGVLFSVSVLSTRMRVNDLIIGLLVCTLYIVAATGYVIDYISIYWQYIMIILINLCHGAAVTITTSLISKMVDTKELGRLNSIQTCMNTLLTFGLTAIYEYTLYDDCYGSCKYQNFVLMILLYGILTIPILFAFMTIYSKYKHFWYADTTTMKQKSNIYIINTKS